MDSLNFQIENNKRKIIFNNNNNTKINNEKRKRIKNEINPFNNTNKLKNGVIVSM